ADVICVRVGPIRVVADDRAFEIKPVYRLAVQGQAGAVSGGRVFVVERDRAVCDVRAVDSITARDRNAAYNGRAIPGNRAAHDRDRGRGVWCVALSATACIDGLVVRNRGTEDCDISDRAKTPAIR